MKIADLLAKESIDLQAKVNSKAEALEHLVTLMAKSGKLVDEAEYPELAAAVCMAKKDRIIDDFVYASVSPAYLSAMIDSL